MSNRATDLGRPWWMDSKDARRENTFWASFPHCPKGSTASGMHTHPSSWHLASLVECFLHSAAWAAAPEEVLASLKVAGVRGEVTVKSKACLYPNPEPTHQLDVC